MNAERIWVRIWKHEFGAELMLLRKQPEGMFRLDPRTGEWKRWLVSYEDVDEMPQYTLCKKGKGRRLYHPWDQPKRSKWK